MKLKCCICRTLMCMLLFGYSKSARMLKLGGESIYSSTKEVFIQAGRDANIKCETNESSSKTDHGDVGDIVWMKQHEVAVEPHDTVVITDCTEESINCENGTLSILTLKNTAIADAGLYSCYPEVQEILHTNSIDGSHLYVGYPPDQPTIESDDFIAYLSDDILESCWSIGNSTYIPTNYTLTHHDELDPTTQKTNCEGNSTFEVCCVFTYSNRYFEHSMVLEASNALGNATSMEQLIRPCKHAKSSSPTNIKLRAISTQHENKIVANWSEPEESGIDHYTYKIRFKEKGSNNPWKNQYGTIMPEITLDGLRSETEYVLQVSARPEDNSGVVEGVWSDWSESESTTTGLSAPMAQFIFNQPVTTIMSSGENFLVDVSWHPYEHQEESEFHSKILYGDCDQDQAESNVTGASHFTFETEEKNICVEGKHCNKAGCSKSDYKTIYTSRGPPAVENVVVTSINETHLPIKWSPPTDKRADCSIQICSNSRISEGGNTTLEPYNRCGFEGFSFVKSMDGNCSLGYASVLGEWSPCFFYSVIVELREDNFIVQSNPSSKITYDPPSKSVGYFNINDMSTPDNFKIGVEWPKIDSCHYMPLSIIYQPVEGAECDGEGDGCDEVFTKTVNCEDDSTTISQNVYGNTRYNVQMALICNAADESTQRTANSPYSVPIGEATGETQTRVGYPDPPRDLELSTVIKPEAVLRWAEPLHKNGQPVYKIIQSSTNQPFMEKMEETTTKTSINTNIGCLDENNDTIVSFSVRAVNTDLDGSSFMSDESVLSVSCVIQKDPLPTGVDPTIILAVCIPLIILGTVMLAFYCFRKRIKTTLKTHVWPDLPNTTIAINVMPDEYSAETYSKAGEVADDIMMPFSKQEKTPLHQSQATEKETSDQLSTCVTLDKEASLSGVNHGRQDSDDSGHCDCGFGDDKLPINSYAFECARETTLMGSDVEDEPYCEAPPPQPRVRLDSSGYSSYNGDSGCSDRFRVCHGSSGSCSTGSCRPHSFSGTNSIGYAKENVRFCQDLWQKKPLLGDDDSTGERLKDIEADILNDSSELLPKGSIYKPPLYVKVCKPVLRRYWSWSDLNSTEISKADDEYIDEATWREHVATPKDIAPVDLSRVIVQDAFTYDDSYIVQPEHAVEALASKTQKSVFNITPMITMEENGPYVDVGVAMQM